MALSLAIAELSLQFEHRDLHWGNVLVKRTQKNMLHYNLCGDDHELDPHGVQVAIIDFTLSRLTKGENNIHTSNLVNVKIFVMEFLNFLRKISGNFIFIKCWEPW